MADQPPFERTARINNLSMEIAELVGKLEPRSELSTNPYLHRKLRVRTIYSSLIIEGNALSEEAVTAILDGKRVLGPPVDIREVENAQRAYELLPELDPLKQEDVLRAHQALMETLVSDAGRYRSRDAGVYREGQLIHMGTPARHLAEVMDNLFDWLARTEEHPLIASCIFHYEFEFIHPFSDGNGRLGRLWQTLILSQWNSLLQWIPVESLIARRQDEYYQRFLDSHREGSSTLFVEFMLEIIADALRPFATQATAQEQRAQVALEFFRAHPKATVPDLAHRLEVSLSTAERVLKELRERGLVIRHGSARSGSWEVTD